MEKKLTIPYSEFEFNFVRSSGPGGQNVNKVNSKAVLRWNLKQSQSISEEICARLQEKLSAKLTEEGDLIVTSDRFRDQGRNREDAIEKFNSLIAQALHVPKKRKKTKQSYSSKLKAQQSNQRHSEKKKNRSFKY
jgi:ribosome-associated protein